MLALTSVQMYTITELQSIAKDLALPCATTAVLVTYLYSWCHLKRRQRLLDSRRLEYQRCRESQLSHLQNHLDTKQLSEAEVQAVTSLDYETLRCKLLSGELSCVKVLHCHQIRALRLNAEFNFIAGFILEAEDWAAQLDALPQQEKDKLPLLGMLMSVKENFKISGYCCTIGCSNNIGSICTSTAPTYQALMNAGAIPYIRTNLSQTMVSLAAHNPIYGQTRNPLDPVRSPGGSSSGEAASIACGCSAIGLGTDLGGSVRVPAAWCGVFALKPTNGRISSTGIVAAAYGINAGLLSRDMDSLIAMMKVLSSHWMYDTDPDISRCWFNEEELDDDRPLTIGYLTHSGVPTTDSAISAVTEVAAELMSKGHKVISWTPPVVKSSAGDVIDPARLMLLSCYADAGGQFKELMYGDRVSYVIQPLMSALAVPTLVKRAVGAILGWLMPSWWVFKTWIGPAGFTSCNQFFRHIITLNTYKQAWLDSWSRCHLDVLITPATPIPAELIDTSTSPASGCGSFTYPMNLVNFPAGVVPWRKISPEEEVYDLMNFPDDCAASSKLKKSVAGSAGLPLSVQVISLPFREEKCLRVMRLISKLSRNQRQHQSAAGLMCA